MVNIKIYKKESVKIADIIVKSVHLKIFVKFVKMDLNLIRMEYVTRMYYVKMDNTRFLEFVRIVLNLTAKNVILLVPLLLIAKNVLVV
jgi:hypothetical protein